PPARSTKWSQAAAGTSPPPTMTSAPRACSAAATGERVDPSGVILTATVKQTREAAATAIKTERRLIRMEAPLLDHGCGAGHPLPARQRRGWVKGKQLWQRLLALPRKDTYGGEVRGRQIVSRTGNDSGRFVVRACCLHPLQLRDRIVRVHFSR